MNHVASLTVPRQEPSFLRFGTWSVLLHVGIVAIVSFLLHFSHTIDKPRPLVKVTLIEVPTPKPTPQEAEPQAPPMLQTQRHPPRPTPPQPIVPPPQLHVPTAPTHLAKGMPQSPIHQFSLPLKRRILQDQRATDTLQLRDMMKPVAHGDFRPTRTKTQQPSIIIPALSPVAARSGISTTVAALPASSRAGSFAKPARTLRSTPTSTGSLQTGVSLKRRTSLLYPRIAKEEGLEGTVVLLVSVTPSGRADKITIERTSGHEALDNAAIDTVTQWTFSPAKDGNIPIRSIVKIPINFSLTQQG